MRWNFTHLWPVYHHVNVLKGISISLTTPNLLDFLCNNISHFSRSQLQNERRTIAKTSSFTATCTSILSVKLLAALLILWQVILGCSSCLSSATDFGFGENLRYITNKLLTNTMKNCKKRLQTLFMKSTSLCHHQQKYAVLITVLSFWNMQNYDVVSHKNPQRCNNKRVSNAAWSFCTGMNCSQVCKTSH